VSTFYNGYSLSASLPVFDGFQRLNHLRAAKASILMGNSQIQAQRDELALKVYEAYCNVLYFQGTVQMTREKRNQSQMTLRQTQVMCEVGQKSEADVAQMEAQLAADEYEITRQENELKTAMLTLRQLMGMETLPKEGSDDLQEEDFTLKPIDYMEATEVSTSLPTGRDKRESLLPSLQAADLNVNVARHQLNVAKGALSPSLSINGGVSTSFNKMLHAEATPFRDQLKNNKGEYVYASVNIPLFNRMQTLTNIRRQRNNLRIAEEQLAQKREELTKLQLQAAYDCEGYRKQTLQMEEKVEADSLACQLTTRQYEEGLASSIDVQTTSATLLKSRAQLLQCRLMWALKQKLVNYYQGIPLL
jgi:outer membrane protein